MKGVLQFAWSMVLLTGCATPEIVREKASAADDPRLNDGALLASVCSGCHASGGETLVDLASYDALQIETLLMTYKQTPDGPSAMHRMARGYTREQIRLIADFLSRER